MNYKNTDCISFLKELEDRTIDLIAIDPPYYRVVNDKWDNQWFTIDEYYEWCEQWIKELGRVSKWSGSLWIFGYPQQLTYLLPIIEKYGFTFRQQIIVNKGMRSVAGRTSNKLKMFPTATESIFFFHYDARDHIRELLLDLKDKNNMTGKDMNSLLGKATSGGGTFSCIASFKKPREHRIYPTKEDWKILSTLGELPNYDDLVYKFNIISGLTDVWDDIDFYDRKEVKFHSTQKPIPLMDRIILSSSNPNDTVLDCFSGSGSTAVSCIQNNRQFVGCEIDEEYYQKSMKRIETALNKNQTTLYSFF
jgi:DNA modification methylase